MSTSTTHSQPAVSVSSASAAQSAMVSSSAATATFPAVRRPLRTYSRAGKRKYRVTLWRMLVSELIKLRSLVSTYWLLALTVAFAISITAISVWTIGFTARIDSEGNMHDTIQRSVEATLLWQSVSASLNIVIIVVAILGVLNMSGEYSTGLIRSTLLASPSRWRVYLAKVMVIATTTFLATLVAFSLSWALASIMSDSWDVQALADSQWRLPWVVLLLGPTLSALIALIGLGFGALTRSTAGGIGIVIVIIFVLPTVFSIISIASSELSWFASVNACLPSHAIDIAMSGGLSADSAQEAVNVSAEGQAVVDAAQTAAKQWKPNWWQSALVVAAWSVLINIAGYARFARSDVQ